MYQRKFIKENFINFLHLSIESTRFDWKDRYVFTCQKHKYT